MERSLRPEEPFLFTDARQRRIYERLKLLGVSPAMFFADACRIMDTQPAFYTATHLISHCLREIESTLRATLDPIKDQTGLPESKDGHRTAILAILKGLNIPEDDSIAVAWLSLIGQSNAVALHKRAHRNNLADPRPLSDEFETFWNTIQTIFDVILAKFEAQYLKWIGFLETLAKKEKPTQEDIKTLQLNIPPTDVVYTHFFKTLSSSSAQWLEPLQKAGFFEQALQAQYTDQQFVSFPDWPASDYLLRMATTQPERVVAIMRQLPPTDNWHVHETIVATALIIDLEFAINLIEPITSALKSPYRSRVPMMVGTLISRFLEGQRFDAAFRLVPPLLEVVSDRPDTTTLSSEQGLKFYRPRSRFNDDWQYEQIIQNHLTALCSADPQRMFNLLCNALEKAVTISITEGSSPDDFSYIWRPAIEPQQRNPLSSDPRQILVSAVRDSAESIVDSNPEWNLIDSLDQRPWNIFKRIALHILRKVPQSSPDMIRRYLNNPLIRTDLHFRHEYVLLVEAQFQSLPEGDKTAILNWIEQGPNTDEIPAFLQKLYQRPKLSNDIVCLYLSFGWHKPIEHVLV